MAEEKQATVGFCFVALLVLVALVVLSVLRWFAADPPSWPSTLAILVVAVSMLAAGRLLANPLWGLALALLLSFHPDVRHWAANDSKIIWTQALALAALAGLLGGVHLIFRKSFLPVAWGILGVATLGGVCVLWLLQPWAGLIVGGFLVVGFVLATAIGFAKKQANQLSIWNLLSGVVLAIVPIGGLFLAPVVSPWLHLVPAGIGGVSATRLLETAVVPGAGNAVFRSANVHRWAWPLAWVVVPLMIYGFYRTFRRGWRQLSGKAAPSAWGLMLFGLSVAVGTVLNPAIMRATHDLPWATLAMLLAMFGLTDWLVGIGERLRLGPPTE